MGVLGSQSPAVRKLDVGACVSNGQSMKLEILESAVRQSKGSSERVIQDLFMQRLHSIGPRRRILDLGAGKGALVRRVQDSGLAEEIVGLDYTPRPADVPPDVAWIRSDLNFSIPLGTDSFDIVCCSEVIEHLENPRHLAREMARVLAPKGVALVSTPNNESLRARLSFALRGMFPAFVPAAYPAHITPLLRLTLRQIFNEAGFTNIGFWFTNCGALPKLSVRWQQILPRKVFEGVLFSDNLLIQGSLPDTGATAVRLSAAFADSQ